MKKNRRDDCGGMRTICLEADSKEEAAGGFTSVQQTEYKTFCLCCLDKGGNSCISQTVWTHWYYVHLISY